MNGSFESQANSNPQSEKLIDLPDGDNLGSNSPQFYHTLQYEVLPLAANPESICATITVTPGQKLALSADCVEGLSKDSREFIASATEILAKIITPPTMDEFLVSGFMGLPWPDRYPSQPNEEARSNFEKRYPSLL